MKQRSLHHLLSLMADHAAYMRKLCNEEGDLKDIKPFIAGIRRALLLQHIALNLPKNIVPQDTKDRLQQNTQEFLAATMEIISNRFALCSSYMDEVYAGTDDYLEDYDDTIKECFNCSSLLPTKEFVNKYSVMESDEVDIEECCLDCAQDVYTETYF